jgi:hypothetical protein
LSTSKTYDTLVSVKTASVPVFARVPKELYAAICKRQAKVKKQTGIEPRISDVVRVMLAESAAREGAR